MDEFLEYIKQNPQFYPLLKSPQFIQILQEIAKEAVQEQMLSSRFLKIEEIDVKEIIESLQEMKLVGKMNLRGAIFYYVTNEGRNFLEKYSKGSKEFGVL